MRSTALELAELTSSSSLRAQPSPSQNKLPCLKKGLRRDQVPTKLSNDQDRSLELLEEISRAIRFVSSSASFDPFLPPPSSS